MRHLADFLQKQVSKGLRLGAVDFFAPYFQVGLLKRLTTLTKSKGLLLLVGKEPEEQRFRAVWWRSDSNFPSIRAFL